MTTAGYSGTPLARKLGIKPETRLLIVEGPAEFRVPSLPDGVTTHVRGDGDRYETALLFVTARADLSRRFGEVAAQLTVAGGLWVCWPKRAAVRAGVISSDLDENVVREIGLAAGLVDVKVAAIDTTWSGLRFVRRLRDRR